MKLKRIGIVIIVIVAIIVIGMLVKQKVKEEKTEQGPKQNTEYNNITLNEDLSVAGIVENLEGVRWNNANIMQTDGKMEVSIMLNSNVEEKIEARNLKVTLLNKNRTNNSRARSKNGRT